MQCASFPNDLLVSVVMPCLNEARTLGTCIEQAQEGCENAVNALHGAESFGKRFEIVVADNGSQDESREIATKAGATVVSVMERGYGSALLGGIASARGKFVVMGDADSSYDFREIPRFVGRLLEGNELVMGNRFAGGIEPGAMPWLHRYIGNPFLSGFGRLLYPTPCRDWHCGMRGFDRQRILDLHLSCTGMEFASEMVICASRAQIRIVEIPVKLRPDGRDRPPHLRSFRDGWRHLKLMLSRVGQPAPIHSNP